MAKPYQEIRPSQFITTFGPGSIVETPSGPVVLKAMDTLFIGTGRRPDEFEIVDQRLSNGRLAGARITRVPTNPELLLPTDEPIYPTNRFPDWSLCAMHRGHQVLYHAGDGCPECVTLKPWQRREKAGRDAIRFVTACDRGHLDEVPWHSLVHPSGGSCGTTHYLWHGGGRALRLVRIECPKCQSSANFGVAYGRDWRCRGRLPEFGPAPVAGGCPSPARIVQRGAANLRLADLETALTILDMPSRLHDILSGRSMLARLETLHEVGLLDEKAVLAVAQKAGLSADSLTFLEQTPWQAVETALGQLLGPVPAGPHALQDAELEHLQAAATHGAPAVPHPQRLGSPLFEVRRDDVHAVAGPTGMGFRVVPISRLRMVMVQTGYRRLSPDLGAVVPTHFEHTGVTWYPGVEQFGEGIFIDLGGNELGLHGPRQAVWADRFGAVPVGKNATLSDPLIQHPAHVWWHSLSHRLLWALSVDSGYSSAAIRERVYVRLEDGQVTGSGLLLYTVQPGGDGTLGGMISLVKRFDRILARALDDLEVCSNDPLCEEAPMQGADGAACYSCLFASETSCEHRNHGLDRLLLTENLP